LISRRDFNSVALAVGLGLAGPLTLSGGLSDEAVPEAECLVPEPLSGYTMKLWTKDNKIIDLPVCHISPVWGKLVFFGQTTIFSADYIRGVCVLRPDKEIISSYRFDRGDVCVCCGDILKITSQINWNPQGSVDQVLATCSKAPRGRRICHGFEPSTLVGHVPSITLDDLQRLFPERFA
jgi:hypothetical protein